MCEDEGTFWAPCAGCPHNSASIWNFEFHHHSPDLYLQHGRVGWWVPHCFLQFCFKKGIKPASSPFRGWPNQNFKGPTTQNLMGRSNNFVEKVELIGNIRKMSNNLIRRPPRTDKQVRTQGLRQLGELEDIWRHCATHAEQPPPTRAELVLLPCFYIFCWRGSDLSIAAYLLLIGPLKVRLDP